MRLHRSGPRAGRTSRRWPCRAAGRGDRGSPPREESPPATSQARRSRLHADRYRRVAHTAHTPAANTSSCLFSELRGQRCSSGGCPATAADYHRVRKVQLGRSISVWPQPEHYRKQTRGPEPVTRLLFAAARYISLNRPVSLCASTVTCGNIRTCNSTWIVQRMPK